MNNRKSADKNINNHISGRNNRKLRILIFIMAMLLVGASGGCEQFTALVAGELPAVSQPLTTRVYYHDGTLMASRYVENRMEVSLTELPAAVVQATIAVEDRRFHSHFGFDLSGIIRAAYHNILNRQVVQGGSTITQQLVKNLYLSHDRTWRRKADEAIYTIRMETAHTKAEIMEMYLNTIYYGHAAYGIEAASRTYFGKPAAELTLAEGALLAGLPRGPLYYSPFINMDGARNRQAVVLARMLSEGYISEEEKQAALNEPLSLNQGSEDEAGGYIMDYIINVELAHLWAENPDMLQLGGLQIHTAVDQHLQEEAERIFRDDLAVSRTDEQGIRQPQGALLAMEPATGYVRAMVGGRDFKETNLNRTLARRSPGSAFKPFVFAAALEQGRTAAAGFVCEPISLNMPGSAEPYRPTCFGGNFHHRYLTMREAVYHSCNISAIKNNLLIGSDVSAEMARRLGIESNIGQYPSLPLGTSEMTLLEMTTAFAPFANGGQRTEPVLVTEVIDAGGNVLIKNEPRVTQVLDESIAYLMTDMMKDVLGENGTGHRAGTIFQRPAAAKTGTSHNYRDAYIVGYTPDLVTGIYIGDDHGNPLGQTGGQLAAPLWATFMAKAHQNIPVRDFPRPDNIIEVTLCSMTGKKKSDECQAFGITEIFITGTEPDQSCSFPECPACFSPFRWWRR